MAGDGRHSPSRRWFLRRAGVALGVAGSAGCLGTDGESTTDPDSATEGTQTPAPAGTPRPTPDETRTATDRTATPESTARATGTRESATTGTATPIHGDYETTDVRVTTPEGEVLGSVTAAIADTPDLRYLGLSDTGTLPPDRGMLFVFDAVGDRTFVMREMDFGIDIVYADADRRITRIHHAPAPGPDENGASQRYPGRGQYVLEVNYHWTTDHGVTEGDLLAFER